MKILKIFGVVVGIHVFALILIFANPGCSSSSKPAPAPADTAASQPSSPGITPPDVSPTSLPITPAPLDFDPNAPAVAASSGSGVRFTPTRPGTAAAGTLVIEPVSNVQPATTYTVANGDNLWNLSKRYGVTTAEIAAANNIRVTTVLRPGQKLIIPQKAGSSSAAAAVDHNASARKAHEPAAGAAKGAGSSGSGSGDTIRHVVKSGESLSTIARRYDVKQGEIAVANNISDPQKIRAGMELVIPGRKSPAAKNGKATAAKSAPEVETPKPEPTPTIRVEDTAPPPLPSNDVPVIRVDESPITPAPKNP